MSPALPLALVAGCAGLTGLKFALDGVARAAVADLGRRAAHRAAHPTHHDHERGRHVR